MEPGALDAADADDDIEAAHEALAAERPERIRA